MNTQQITEQIYKRHLQALRRVSGEGTWMDEPAVRMALWLSLTEQAERLGGEQPMDESGDLAAAKSEIIELREQLAQMVSLETGLAAAQSETSMLRQQRADLQERLDAKSIDLENEIMNNALLREELAQFKAHQAATVALASPNEHGDQPQQTDHPTRAHPAAVGAEPEPWLDDLNEEQRQAVQQLKDQIMIWKNLPRATKAAITTAVLRQLIVQLAPESLKMIVYDERRPQWMPSASGIAAMFGDQKWSLLIERAQNRRLA